MQRKRTATKIFAFSLSLCFILSALVASLISILGFFEIHSDDLHFNNTAHVSDTDWEGKLGLDTGSNKIFDFATQSSTDINNYNGTTRTYNLYAGEVISDVFTVLENRFYWDPMPSSDVMGLFSQYSVTSVMKFKFYARITGKTEGTLKYSLSGGYDVASWGEIKFVFYVRNNNAAHDPFNSPIGSDFLNRYYEGTDTKVTFEAGKIARNYSSTPSKYRILAGSIAYPGAVDATPLAFYDIGIDIPLNTYTGIGNNFYESMSIGLRYAYYNEFGVEFLVKDIDNGWLGLVNCYVASPADKRTQGIATNVEKRTTILNSNTLPGYNNQGYDSAASSGKVTISTTYTGYNDEARNNNQHILTNPFNPNYASSSGMTYQSKAPIKFDVVVQQTQQMQLYTSAEQFFYCSVHGKEFKGPKDGEHYAPAERAECQVHKGQYGPRGKKHTTYTYAEEVNAVKCYCGAAQWNHCKGYINSYCFHAGSDRPLMNHCRSSTGYSYRYLNMPSYINGSIKSADCYYEKDINTNILTNSCTYDANSPAVSGQRYANWNAVPYYMASLNPALNFPQSAGSASFQLSSKTDEIRIGLKNIVNTNAPNVSAIPGLTVVNDNGGTTYAEIENIYAYDRGYISAGLVRKRNDSYISLIGQRNTEIGMPRYLVLTVVNYQNGVPYRRLVSVDILVTNDEQGANAKAIVRTNREPLKIEKELSPDHSSGGNLHFFGVRGDTKTFVADDTNTLSIAYDEDLDSFTFASGTIIYDDAYGTSSAVAASSFSVKVLDPSRPAQIEVTALKVVNTNFYFKVVDSCGGVGYIEIGCNIKNKKPQFTNLPQSIKLSPSKFTGGVKEGSSWSLTTKSAPATPLANHSYSVASDGDIINSISLDTLTIDVFNWNITNNDYFTYSFPPADTVPGMPGGRTLKFTAKKWTSGINVTLCVFDGYDTEYVTLTVVVENTTVVPTNISANLIFREKAGVTRVFSGNDLGMDFDDDDISIIGNPVTEGQSIDAPSLLATNATNGYISAKIENGELIVTAIAKSVKYDSYFGAGHFGLVVYLKDAGNTVVASTGTKVTIDVTILNSAPIINDFTHVVSESRIFSASQFAFDGDVKEMAYNIPGKASDKMADRLRFVNIVKKTGEFEGFVTFEYLDINNNITNDPDKYYNVRITPQKWTNGTRQVSIIIRDESGDTTVNSSNVLTTVTFTFSVQNAKPISRLSGIGLTVSNPYIIDLAVGDTRYPSEYYFYPYTAVTDRDLQSDLYNTTLLKDSDKPSYSPYPAIKTNPATPNEMGKPVSHITGMDSLVFDNYNYKVDNNSFGYVDIQSYSDTCYRIAAKQKNTDNPNILFTTAVRDASGERVTIYILINVRNSRPQLFDEIIPPTEISAGHSGIPGHNGVPPKELIVVPADGVSNFHEWRIEELVIDNDKYTYGALGTQIDRVTFQTTTYARKKGAIYESDTANIANNADDRIKVTIEPGVINPGTLVLRVEALATTLGSDYLDGGFAVWAGFSVTDGDESENFDVFWIQIKVLNSTPYQNSTATTYTYNVTESNPLPHKIMIRAEDDKVREARKTQSGIDENNAVNNNAGSFSETSTRYPLFVIAKDPDGDDITLRTVGGVTAIVEGKLNTFSKEYINAGLVNWYVVLEFIKDSEGVTTFTVNLSDPHSSQIFKYSMTIMIVNLDLTESYKTIAKEKVEIPVTYTKETLGALYSIDLYDLLSPASEGSEFFETGEMHVRFAENNLITALPNKGDAAYNYEAYTYDGDTALYRANNTSVFINAEDRKYIQILGGKESYMEDDYGTYLQDLTLTGSDESGAGYVKAYFKIDDSSQSRVAGVTKTSSGNFVQAEEGLYIEIFTGEYVRDDDGLYIKSYPGCSFTDAYGIPDSPADYYDAWSNPREKYSRVTEMKRANISSEKEAEDANGVFYIKTGYTSENEPVYAKITGVNDSGKIKYAYYKNAEGGFDLITSQKLYSRAGNQDDSHVRSIWIRGLQRSPNPIEVTFAVNISIGGWHTEYNEETGLDEKVYNYLDLDGDGEFNPIKDVFKFKVKFYVRNASLSDNSAGTGDNKSINLANITTNTQKAVIGTVVSNEANSVALNISDEDRLDTHYISLKSLAVDNSSGAAYNGLNRNYNNLAVNIGSGAYVPFHYYFDIIDSIGNIILGSDANGVLIDNIQNYQDSQFIYIKPKRKTASAGGSVPLYFMVYDDYLNSSKNYDLFHGNDLEGNVSRIIVRVNISIVNFIPTVSKPNPVTVYASYYPNNQNWQTLRLADYFYDSDMQLIESDGQNYFNIVPESSIGSSVYDFDIINKIEIEPNEADAAQIVTIDSVNWKTSDFDIGVSDYYNANTQLIRYLVSEYPNLKGNESTRVRSFNVNFYDGDTTFVTLRLNIYIMNKPPVQTSLNGTVFKDMEFFVGESIVFDTQATSVDYKTVADASGSKGKIKPVNDDETPGDVYVRDVMYDFSSFQELYKDYFTLTRMDITTENAKSFQLTAFNATPLDGAGNPTSVEFKFTVNDGDKVSELNLTECIYNIKVISRPPELKEDRYGDIEAAKVITLGFNKSKNLSVDDLAKDADAGDTLSIYYKPTSYINDSLPATIFYNYIPRGSYQAVTVPDAYQGNSDYLINGVNTNQTTMFNVVTSADSKSLTITALEVNGDTADPQFNTIEFFIVDRANNALPVTLRVVLVNDAIELKNKDGAQSLSLSGAGSATKVTLSNYIKGAGDNQIDADFTSKNNKYAVTVYEKSAVKAGELIKIAEYTTGGIYQHAPKHNDAVSYGYFDIPESGGIENGRTINFVSKRRTEMGYAVPLLIKIRKNVWTYNANLDQVEKEIIELELELNATVTNVAPVVFYKPGYNASLFLSEDYEIKKDEFVNIPLHGKGTLNYLATDADGDELDFDVVKNVKVLDDTLDGDFRKALGIEYDKTTGIIKITAKNKLKNIDSSKHNHPYVTRIVAITVNDGNGGTCEVNLPITIRNSAPVVILSTYTFAVSRGETYSRLVDGELQYQIPLSMFIKDTDYDSLEETFAFVGDDIQKVYSEGGLDIRNTDSSAPERIANVTVSNDSKYFIIKGTSINRGSNTKTRPLDFSVVDGAGDKSGQIRFIFEVGNIAPQPVENTPVINILGGDTAKQRVIFLNESDHNLANANNANKSKFIPMFTDVNPMDTFMLNETQVDVTVANDMTPKILISNLTDYLPPEETSIRIDTSAIMKTGDTDKDLNRKGFIINTMPDTYGEESIFLRVYDSNPSDLNGGALSAVIEIKVNVARNPSELEKETFRIWDKRIEEVTPGKIFGEEHAIGMEFKPGSLELVTPEVPEDGHYVYRGAIEITEDGKIRALKVGDETVLAIIVIGEDQISIIFDVRVDRNGQPNQYVFTLKITQEMIITKDKRYGDIGYYRFSINDIVSDLEGDELTLISVTSNKPAMVDTRMPPFRQNTIDLLTKASGKAELTIVIKDATARHVYKVIYENDSLPKLTMLSAIVADIQAYTKDYILWTALTLGVILAAIITIVLILRRKRMHLDIANLLQYESELDEQMVRIAEGYDFNAGYLKEARENYNAITGASKGDVNYIESGEIEQAPQIGMAETERYAANNLYLGTQMEPVFEVDQTPIDDVQIETTSEEYGKKEYEIDVDNMFKQIMEDQAPVVEEDALEKLLAERLKIDENFEQTNSIETESLETMLNDIMQKNEPQSEPQAQDEPQFTSEVIEQVYTEAGHEPEPVEEEDLDNEIFKQIFEFEKNQEDN